VCGKALEGLEAGSDALEQFVAGAALGAFVGPEHGVTATAAGDGLRLGGTAEVLTGARHAGLLGVPIEAKGTLVVDAPAVTAAADRLGLFVIGIAGHPETEAAVK